VVSCGTFLQIDILEEFYLKLPVLKIGNLQPKYPIIQGGMAVRISTAPLAAAVANAGGIGLIAATGMSVEELKNEIKWARKNTKGIVGINVMFAISKFSQLVYAALEEGIDLIVQGAGFSRNIFKWCKETNTPMVPIVSTPKLAKLSESLGASAVVVEGKEAGGHLGTLESMRKILPEVRKVVSIPVIAAGGIIDAQDIKEAFDLGADGVQMGIRFAASLESNAAPNLKEVYVNAKREDIILIDSPVGLPGRAIRNEFSEKIIKGYDLSPQKCEGCLKRCKKNFCILDALENAQKGNLKEGLIFSGEYVEKIKEILPAGEIIRKLVENFKKL